MEYEKAYRELIDGLRSQYGDALNDQLIKMLDPKNRALTNLINQKLMAQEARKLGLEVTEEEVQNAIMRYPAFQIRGRFDVGRYRALLGQNRMKPEDFEESMAQELLQQKLRQLISTFAPVTDQEVLDYYSFGNEKVKIAFVHFKPEDFEESVQMDQEALDKYFEQNRESYRVPEKIKVAYLLIDPENYIDQIKLEEREIEAYYDFNIDRFQEPKRVRARHILLKLAQDADEKLEKEVRNRAQEILNEVKEGDDFGELARKYSDDPNKSEGGDLGYFSAGTMEKPFEDAAFKLKPGEISDLVRTRFGYHIIKAEDVKEAHTKPLNAVREQVVQGVVMNQATDLAHEKGLSMIDQMPYELDDLGQYGADHGLKASTSEAFSLAETIPGIGGDQNVRRSLFALQEGETSELHEIGGKFYVFQVAERQPSYLPESSEVAERVKRDFVKYLAAKAAAAKAQSFLDDLHKGKDWQECVDRDRLESKETGFFTRREAVPEIGYEPVLNEMAFGLSAEKPHPNSIFESNKGAFVIKWKGHQEIDRGKYEEEREKYRFFLMQTKDTSFFQSWLQDLRKDAKIEIVTPVGS
jgi:peptidyl-prolyl cis-trans isomerase D